MVIVSVGRVGHATLLMFVVIKRSALITALFAVTSSITASNRMEVVPTVVVAAVAKIEDRKRCCQRHGGCDFHYFSHRANALSFSVWLGNCQFNAHTNTRQWVTKSTNVFSSRYSEKPKRTSISSWEIEIQHPVSSSLFRGNYVGESSTHRYRESWVRVKRWPHLCVFSLSE